IFRKWNGYTDDRYTLSCFPLVPWSNRITHGGFMHNGQFRAIKPNREGEPYPIHGDGWLQMWRVADSHRDSVRLVLESHRFDGNPYDYVATQTFTLRPDGLDIALDVTNVGDEALPFGLGLHPYFMRNEQTRLTMRTTGVWLAGDDPIPVSHVNAFPPTWDYNRSASLDGPLIDNCFTGWDGKAVIDYPDRGLSVTMNMEDCSGYTLMYRPPELDYFCLEPITHPIDAFHMEGSPGLKMLAPGAAHVLKASFTIGR
ncbi:MAG: aldose 1-epimerase, partial [Paucimonas sp.]|nr:aldose 1-epimerase [Paucimonas sp.]